jgi:hypothetical protein
MPTAKLTNSIIEAAIHGFEAQKKELDLQIAELRAMMTGAPEQSPAAKTPAAVTRRKFSAAARHRMREAQRLRWAKIRGDSAPAPQPASQVKSSRKMSAASRKAISAAMKKRWANKKATSKAA